MTPGTLAHVTHRESLGTAGLNLGLLLLGDFFTTNAATAATSAVASLNHKELGKSQVPTLEVGDVIEADLWKSNLGGGTVRLTEEDDFCLDRLLSTISQFCFNMGQNPVYSVSGDLYFTWRVWCMPAGTGASA